MQIDSIQLSNPFILAPLAGFTDLPFRLLCREYGADLCYSEMVSSHGLAFQHRKTWNLCRTAAAERPVAIQLFGHDPAIMAEAAAILTEMPVDLIDINMGCPVRKVVKKGGGAALMTQPDLAAMIIKRACAASHLPITVKIRSGWDQDSITAPDFARMAEDCGAKAVAVHGRTWSQGFGGRADWTVIARVKQAISIPVIGNGDVMSHADGLAMIRATGCDGVMIGRAALGNPWVFQPRGTPAAMVDRLAGLRHHLDLIEQHLPECRHLAAIKNHAGRYFKGLPGGSAIRQKIYSAPSFDELVTTLETVQEEFRYAP